MDTLTEALIYAALIFGSGGCVGGYLATKWYERRYARGIAMQENREYQLALDDRDALDYQARMELDYRARMAGL